MRALCAVLAALLFAQPALAAAAEGGANAAQVAAPVLPGSLAPATTTDSLAMRATSAATTDTLATAAACSPCDDPRLNELRLVPGLSRTDAQHAELAALEARCTAWHRARIAQGLERPNHTTLWFGLGIGAVVVVGIVLAVRAADRQASAALAADLIGRLK